MADSFDIEGEKDLVQSLREIGKLFTPTDLRSAMELGMKPIENAAVRLAPVRRGVLRRSIHSISSMLPDRSILIRIGTDVDHGLFQEFGTSRNPAHPYLRPAYLENKSRALRDLQSILRDVLRSRM